MSIGKGPLRKRRVGMGLHIGMRIILDGLPLSQISGAFSSNFERMKSHSPYETTNRS